jgi:fatty-acyl-CoA synthase
LIRRARLRGKDFMEMHFATVWEHIADTVPERIALVHGDTRRSWREYDERAARFAAALAAAGLQPDSKVGLYLYNGNEYLEAQYGAFKQRAVPVNVNYRYLDAELWYLLDNADAEALVFHSSLGDRVERVRHRLPKLKLLVEVDDGGPALDGVARYEELLAAHEPAPRMVRDEADIYMLYTGGTTGMPKGVMYPIGSMTASFILRGCVLYGLPVTVERPEDIATLVPRLAAEGGTPVCITACPLMHGTGVWLGAFITHAMGGTLVTLAGRSFDGHAVWATARRERASHLVIVGDAFAKPLIRALDEAAARGEPHDTSAVRCMISSGVMWTAEVKEALLERVPRLRLVDTMGSTEGAMGASISERGAASATARFIVNPTTRVFTEDGREVAPGSGEAGLVAAGGNVPLGYYKDPEKSARTFRVIDGERYAFPGDWAMVEADGTLTLLGRGSQCINTGGEKVYPEEVEEAVKRLSGVEDCLVVGVPDETFGEAIVAVVSTAAAAAVGEAAIIAGCRSQLAHYKAPRRVVFVAAVPRAPNGKADYKTARATALGVQPG